MSHRTPEEILIGKKYVDSEHISPNSLLRELRAKKLSEEEIKESQTNPFRLDINLPDPHPFIKLGTGVKGETALIVGVKGSF